MSLSVRLDVKRPMDHCANHHPSTSEPSAIRYQPNGMKLCPRRYRMRHSMTAAATRNETEREVANAMQRLPPATLLPLHNDEDNPVEEQRRPDGERGEEPLLDEPTDQDSFDKFLLFLLLLGFHLTPHI